MVHGLEVRGSGTETPLLVLALLQLPEKYLLSGDQWAQLGLVLTMAAGMLALVRAEGNTATDPLTVCDPF